MMQMLTFCKLYVENPRNLAIKLWGGFHWSPKHSRVLQLDRHFWNLRGDSVHIGCSLAYVSAGIAVSPDQNGKLGRGQEIGSYLHIF